MTTNPALSPLQFLAGAWDMQLSGAAFLPDPDASVHGPVTFESADGGKTWEHHFMVHYSRLAPR
jgi:hypothetical protein